MSVTEKICQKIFCQKHLFSEFGPLEIRLKYEKFEIVEDIHTNCVVHFEKLWVFLKDLHMKFISDKKLYFIKVLWRHNESTKFKNILSFQRLPVAQKNIFWPKIIFATEIWKVSKILKKKSWPRNFFPVQYWVLIFEKLRNIRFWRTYKRWLWHF